MLGRERRVKCREGGHLGVRDGLGQGIELRGRRKGGRMAAISSPWGNRTAERRHQSSESSRRVGHQGGQRDRRRGRMIQGGCPMRGLQFFLLLRCGDIYQSGGG